MCHSRFLTTTLTNIFIHHATRLMLYTVLRCKPPTKPTTNRHCSLHPSRLPYPSLFIPQNILNLSQANPNPPPTRSSAAPDRTVYCTVLVTPLRCCPIVPLFESEGCSGCGGVSGACAASWLSPACRLTWQFKPRARSTGKEAVSTRKHQPGSDGVCRGRGSAPRGGVWIASCVQLYSTILPHSSPHSSPHTHAYTHTRTRTYSAYPARARVCTCTLPYRTHTHTHTWTCRQECTFLLYSASANSSTYRQPTDNPLTLYPTSWTARTSG